ncbi:TolC family protein [Sphingomonas sp.]|uniref:TolC family protein n=1 Tax=Sphingomonas sp. TaxID=28214 RepID=UPI00286C78E2|nr:TolC family protein [Sphingomonas sp.]
MTRALPLLALLLAGCASVERAPPATLAEAMLPPAFAALDRETAAAGSVAGLLPRSDPAFLTLEARALATAPTLAAAMARIDAARGAVRGAGAARLPEINASGTVDGQRISTGQAGATPPGVSIDQERLVLSGGLSASWDADLFGRLRANQRAAVARLDAAGADAAAVRVALQSDIARAVIDARSLVEREAVARADIDSAAALVSLTGVRSRAGIVAGFDLVRATSLDAEARAQLAPIAAERAAIIGRLVTLVAIPAQDVIAALATNPSPLPRGATPVLGVPSLLLRARPDVAAAERRLAAADQDIAAAAAERYPRLTLGSALGLLSLGLGNLASLDSVTGSLSAGLAGPLLDFGRVAARIGQRQADARASFADYYRLLFTALGETEAALGAIAAADQRVVLLQRQVDADRDAVGLAAERHRLGLDPFLTVVDARRSANRSRFALVAAQAESYRTRIELYRAIGGDARPGL